MITWIGLRVHVAVVRNGYDCTLYINGQASGHSISTVSVVYKNAYLVFGMDYRNKSSYFEGTMDHIAIYSQPLSESSINSLYNSEVGAPTPAPSSQATSTPQATSNSNGSGGSSDKGGCDLNCIISITSIIGTFIGIFVSYHIYWMTRRGQDPPSTGNNTSRRPDGNTPDSTKYKRLSTKYFYPDRAVSEKSNPLVSAISKPFEIFEKF